MTDEKRLEILAQISVGCPPITAAQRCGVNKQTYHEYWKRHPEFQDQVEEAQAKAESGLYARMLRFSETQWLACAWLLERRFGYVKPESKSSSRTAEELAQMYRDAAKAIAASGGA